MPCNCGGGAPQPVAVPYEVRLPDGSRKIVNSEHEAKVAVTMAGGGTYSKV